MTLSIFLLLKTVASMHAGFFSNFIYSHTHTLDSREHAFHTEHSIILSLTFATFFFHFDTIRVLFFSFAFLSVKLFSVSSTICNLLLPVLLHSLLLNADKRSRFLEAWVCCGQPGELTRFFTRLMSFELQTAC